MLELNKYSKLLILFYIGLVVFWLVMFFTGSIDTTANFVYGFFLGVLPVLGGFLGFLNAEKWGNSSSAVGKSLLLFSAGLVSWGVGTIIFAYYNIFLQIDVPYPSLADLFYIISWPLWSFGVVYLSLATGVKFSFKKIGGKTLLFIIPILTALISYYLLVVVARGGELLDSSGTFWKLFFDLAYPIGDVVILTIVSVVYGLSVKYLGGYFKLPVIIIFLGFIVNYFADFSFSYTTTAETFYVAGWVDLIFTTAMFLLSLGVALLDTQILNRDAQPN